ncbi:MAG: AsnC family transcriptional regulator [Methylobacteriaceae bacterium]|nr:AsnC family transcriptional regulator [Methylobacteriaceae bacterium]
MSGREQSLDALDRAILEATQAGLPIVAEPYKAIAERVGASEAEVLARLQAMLDRSVVRRIGFAPNHYKLGLTCNGMTVWDVDDEKVDALGEMVGALDFVTHCYRRPRHLPDWPYNLFAMAHGRTRAEVLEKRTRIVELLGAACRSSDILFSTEILKKTGMRLARRAREEASCSD